MKTFNRNWIVEQLFRKIDSFIIVERHMSSSSSVLFMTRTGLQNVNHIDPGIYIGYVIGNRQEQVYKIYIILILGSISAMW
jgi:hypothetical protein